MRGNAAARGEWGARWAEWGGEPGLSAGEEAGLGERREWAEGRGAWAVWVRLGFLVFPPLLFHFLFLTQTKLSYLNSNLNLNSTLTLKQNKIMHQHECNNQF